MPFVPKSPFPNVPKLPGVPQVARSAQFPATVPPAVTAALALGRLWQALFTQPTWAIYQSTTGDQTPTENLPEGVQAGVTTQANRSPVVVPDSFLSFGYRSESNVSSYPVQLGSFTSYDKVANPYEIFVKMSKGGTKEDRQQFLDSIDAIVDSTDLYDIITPERTYVNANVTRFDVVREGAKGAYFFAEVNLYFIEIRQTTSVYSNTPTLTGASKDPSARPVVNIGTVQPQLIDVTPDLLSIEAPSI